MIRKDLNQTKSELLMIWKNILKVESLKSDDNFFWMGGHSLMAIDLLTEIEENLNVKLSMKDLVDYPSVDLLSSFISSQNEMLKTSENIHFNENSDSSKKK